MIVIISDASTLILLEKIKLLASILKKDRIIIPPAVYREAVTKGKEKNHPDAFEIGKKIENKSIQVIEVKNKCKINEIKTNFNLADGESEAIVLLHENRGNVVALDDLKAMHYCNYYGLPFTTAIDFVLDYFGKKLISKRGAEEMIKNLGIFGRYKDDIIFYALKQIEGDRNG